MSQTEAFFKKLIQKFPQLEAESRVARERRIFSTVKLDDFLTVAGFMHGELGFTHLSTITGLDEGENFAPMYHFARDDSDGTVISMRVLLPKSGHKLPSITGLYRYSEYYERELIDLFGIDVAGLPEGSRYPLPDNWPAGQYPLRKDWNASMLNDTNLKSKNDGE